MIPTKIYKVKASINKGKTCKDYISVENENGVLLVNDGLFVISFNNEDEIPYYKKEKLIIEL